MNQTTIDVHLSSGLKTIAQTSMEVADTLIMLAKSHPDFQKWSISYINLYTNGEYDKTRWPESGINPKIISIRHINQPINSQKTK